MDRRTFLATAAAAAPILPTQAGAVIAPTKEASFAAMASAQMWQDLARCVPALADGDPVAVYVDPHGREYKAPSLTARPVLRAERITFDGVDDVLEPVLTRPQWEPAPAP